MTPSFFSSPFWLDVRRTLERAPRFIPGGGSEWVREASVARRLLENRLLCVRQAIDRADGETYRRLRNLLAGLEIEPVLASLLDTLNEAVLIVGASASVGGAVGAGLGSLFGGVGALPGFSVGAALGAKVGLWLLSVLGLAALADFFLEGLPEILGHYQRGFATAWQAGRDEVTERNGHWQSDQSFQIFRASGSIAQGHTALVLLLLSAIVAYLARGRGSVQGLAEQAATGRLGPKFAQWLVQHETQLRDHPVLQRRQRRPSSAAGDEGGGPPSPPPPPPPRRDDREPGIPGRMPRKDVRCFSTSDLPESKLPEFDRQLSGQEAGLNRMTVDEYLSGRKAFNAGEVTRDPQAARKARARHEVRLRSEYTRLFRAQGIGFNEAAAKAADKAVKQMKTLAALHNPDMTVGGADVIASFGDRNVNSRIGALWNAGKQSRLADLDKAALEVPESARSITAMNAKLERCK